jgi:hypothetical protein
VDAFARRESLGLLLCKGFTCISVFKPSDQCYMRHQADEGLPMNSIGNWFIGRVFDKLLDSRRIEANEYERGRFFGRGRS